MDDWLLAARNALAEAANLSPDELDLEEDDESTLLELARLAAHESGVRTNAPLLCYLIGRARHGASLEALAESLTSMRLREERGRAQAPERDVRGGGIGRNRGDDGAAGLARPRRAPVGAEGADQRRDRRRRDFRGADRQGARRRGHAVCSTSKVDLVMSLGADRVIDYTREDFTRTSERFDLIFDVAGSKRWSEARRVLKPDGRFVLVGTGRVSHNPVIGPLAKLAPLMVAGRLRGGGRMKTFIAKFTKPDMGFLGELMADGQLKPVVEKTYDLSQVREALDYLGEGHARGKIVLTV